MDITALSTLWVLIALIIFLGILVWAKVPSMITNALDEKSAKIAADLEEAMRLREEAQALLAEYERKRKEAESQADDIVEKAKQDAERMKAEQEQQLKDMVERRTKAAEAKIALAEQQAIQEVRSRASEVAVIASQDLMGSMMDEQGESLVDDALNDLKNVL